MQTFTGTSLPETTQDYVFVATLVENLHYCMHMIQVRWKNARVVYHHLIYFVC